MIVLSANHISKSYGINEVLSDVSFHLNKGERVGLVGQNGAGKTTLLNMLAGDLPLDDGDFFISEYCNIGYLKQNNPFSSDKTVYEEMLDIFSHLILMEQELSDLSHKISMLAEKGQDVHSLLHLYDDLSEAFKKKNGYAYKSEILGILNSMGFAEDYFDKPVSVLSGGEKTRLALAGLLLKKPDLLLLDEPTNHLDIDTLRWLEQYLKTYEGSILLISHDRYFLDQIASRIFEVENKRLSAYVGNYTDYAQKKKALQENAQKLYDIQQKEIHKQEEIIRRFKQHGTEKLAKRARSRENALSHIEHLEKPAAPAAKIKIHFKQSLQSGNDVLHAENLSKRFDQKLLFQNISFDIKKGEKVSLVGPNGIGKTTLLKMILSMMPFDSGLIKPGFHVRFGYYDQTQELLDPANTVIDEMHSQYRLYNEQELRSILGRFLFKGDDVFKPVSALSGGEKARLSLLKLMLSGANFLVMDEPTNHLDIQSKEIFEDALLEFPGAVLFVSHDRYFLNKVPSRTLELSESAMTAYLGNYDYYLEKRTDLPQKISVSGKQCTASDASEPETDRILSQKEQYFKNKEVEKVLRAKKRELSQCEGRIKELESNIAALEQEMCLEDNYSDYEKMGVLHEKSIAMKKELDETYERWAYLSEKLDEN